MIRTFANDCYPFEQMKKIHFDKDLITEWTKEGEQKLKKCFMFDTNIAV